MADQPSVSHPRPLIFVLGAPCSGKSSISQALAARHALDHFNLGDELRSLISATPTGAAADIKPLFPSDELAILESNLRAGTLGPAELTPKYVLARLFGSQASSERMIIDGFPRKPERWSALKDGAKAIWVPDEGTMVIVLNVTKEVARKRFLERKRLGDEFERRFQEHEGLIGSIIDAVKRDGVGVVEVEVGEEMSVDDIVTIVESNEAWNRVVGIEAKGKQELQEKQWIMGIYC